MNLREGTRRLALLLGVAGAIVGGFASYMELQTVSAQTTAHKQFEQLANSGIVQQQRKALQSPPDYDALAKKYGGTVVQPQSAHPPIDLSAGLDAPPDSTPPGDKVKLDWSTSVPIPSIVMEGGIRTINWSHDYGVQSIETEDGQNSLSDAPTRRMVLFPDFYFACARIPHPVGRDSRDWMDGSGFRPIRLMRRKNSHT